MKLVLAIAAALLASTASAQNLSISGGPIYTGVAARPTAELVVVQAGRITYVGRKAGLRMRLAPGTQSIDLAGAALFPGFTDSHAHLRGIGDRELTLNLEGAKSAAEAAGHSRTAARATCKHPRTWSMV